MKGMSLNMNIYRIAALVALTIFMMGCSNGNDTAPSPSIKSTLTFNDTGGTLNYTSIDVKVEVPPETIGPGEMVSLTVQVMPQNFPIRGVAGSIHERIGWLSLLNTGDPDLQLLKEITIYFPLDGDYIPNENYTVFFFNPTSGQWVSTGKVATIMDNGTHAVFTANAFGTWGVFRGVPLKVDATASRTSAKAPASITLKAVIDGGAPPYSVLWFYGDDSEPEDGLSVSHFYEFAMTYSPCCIVVDSANHTATDYIDINLN